MLFDNEFLISILITYIINEPLLLMLLLLMCKHMNQLFDAVTDNLFVNKENEQKKKGKHEKHFLEFDKNVRKMNQNTTLLKSKNDDRSAQWQHNEIRQMNPYLLCF